MKISTKKTKQLSKILERELNLAVDFDPEFLYCYNDNCPAEFAKENEKECEDAGIKFCKYCGGKLSKASKFDKEEAKGIFKENSSLYEALNKVFNKI